MTVMEIGILLVVAFVLVAALIVLQMILKKVMMERAIDRLGWLLDAQTNGLFDHYKKFMRNLMTPEE